MDKKEEWIVPVDESTDKTKMVIVVRKDLKMPRGKIAAQTSHASVGALVQSMFGKRLEESDFDGFQINTGNTSPEQMRSINEEADTRVVQGLLTISNILEKYREKKVNDDAKNAEEAEVVSTEESKS